MWDSPWERPMSATRLSALLAENQGTGIYALLQVPNLITPLRHNPQCILQERNHNQETTNCRQMGFQRLRINLDVVLYRLAERSELLERVVGVGGSVAWGGARVGEPMWVGIVVGLRASNADSRRHGGKGQSRGSVVGGERDVSRRGDMIMSANHSRLVIAFHANQHSPNGSPPLASAFDIQNEAIQGKIFWSSASFALFALLALFKQSAAPNAQSRYAKKCESGWFLCPLPVFSHLSVAVACCLPSINLSRHQEAALYSNYLHCTIPTPGRLFFVMQSFKQVATQQIDPSCVSVIQSQALLSILTRVFEGLNYLFSRFLS